MNSQLNTNAGCGRKFNLAAHYHVFTHENKAWRDTYSKSFKLDTVLSLSGRKGKEDTSKCLWSKVPWCDYIGFKNSTPKLGFQANFIKAIWVVISSDITADTLVIDSVSQEAKEMAC